MKKLCSVKSWRGPLRGCVIGVLWNPHALWVGAHYSKYNRRLCVNIVPCLTVWLSLEGGTEP